jgi:ankyrin repeat protein
MKPIQVLTTLLLCTTTANLRGGSRLTDAVYMGDIPAIKAAVKAGEKLNDFDRYGWTPTMWAAFYGQHTTLRWLLSRGADPNLASTKDYRYFPKGATALGIATYSSDTKSVEILMNAKADPEVGIPATMFAKRFGCESCIALMDSKPKPGTSQSPATDPSRSEKVDDLLIVLESKLPKPYFFLSDVRDELNPVLKEFKLRSALCVSDPSVARNLVDELEVDFFLQP